MLNTVRALTRSRPASYAAVAAVVAVCGRSATAEQQPAASDPLAETANTQLVLPSTFDGPPVPLAPAVVTRDSEGRATIRAVRVDAPLRMDGRLTELIYEETAAVSDFIQTEPVAGAAATERTEAWVVFDETNLYISFRCWESQPERMIANEMRRDSNTIGDNDHVAIVLDTFYDRRNSVYFAVNAIGGRLDGQMTGMQYNGDWNPIWVAEVGQFDGGWSVEVAIPFKTLRYRPKRRQVWGINLQRTNRWKNELSYVTRLSNAMGRRAIIQVHQAATLVGLEVPPGSRNIEIKPYAVFGLTTDATTRPSRSTDGDGDVGIDVKYGLTENMTADFTYNTDFGQVEADEQQVNLTRFSLFFPEKREFFLENQGLLQFAAGGATGGPMVSPSSDTPVMFYSRRIGLQAERAVPILGGGRLTGRLGAFRVGALNINTEDSRDSRRTNFSVLRLQRDVLRRSSVGALYTKRSITEVGDDSNQLYGIDGLFNFYDNLAVNTYWARTKTDSLSGSDTSYRIHLDYAGDRYGVQMEHLVIGDNFNPDLGFIRRDDMRKSLGSFRFSPRLADSRLVRMIVGMASFNYIETTAGRVDTREATGESAIAFENGDRLSVMYTNTYEFIPRPFTLAPDVVVQAGGYTYANVRVNLSLARQHTIAGRLTVERGTFYGGHKTGVSFSRGRVEITPRLAAEPNVAVNRVTLSQGSFTSRLIGSRLTFTMSPRMFASVLIQYNSGVRSVGTNARLRWEYAPGSELFFVYNDQRDTVGLGFPELVNRAIIVKINRLLRF